MKLYALKSYGTVEVVAVEVERETPKRYYFAKHHPLTLVLYVNKCEVDNHGRYFTTPEAAVSTTIERLKYRIAYDTRKLKELTDRLAEVEALQEAL